MILDVKYRRIGICLICLWCEKKIIHVEISAQKSQTDQDKSKNANNCDHKRKRMDQSFDWMDERSSKACCQQRYIIENDLIHFLLSFFFKGQRALLFRPFFAIQYIFIGSFYNCVVVVCNLPGLIDAQEKSVARQ
jgi:hypothetical protein